MVVATNECKLASSFQENRLTLNYQFSSILFEETPKFEACMNTYSWN